MLGATLARAFMESSQTGISILGKREKQTEEHSAVFSTRSQQQLGERMVRDISMSRGVLLPGGVGREHLAASLVMPFQEVGTVAQTGSGLKMAWQLL